MANTKVRSSKQLYIDDHLDHNSKKAINLLDGTANTDGVNKGQMDTAISNAVSGSGNSIHVPVADLAAAKAVAGNTAPNGHVDKMIMLVETLGLYRYDAESSAASNDDTVIRPADIGSDASAGRWIKMSSTITDHNNLSGKQGGTTGEYYHLTAAEVAKLTGIEAGADVTDAGNVAAAITGSSAAAIADADVVPFVASAVLKKITWANIKSTLVTYFNTLYNMYVHPNHTGDVTSVADGAQTIAANAVTNTKLADMATQTFKGRNTAATGDPEDLSIATVKSMLGLNTNNQSSRTYRATPTGTINGTNAIFTIAQTVISGTEEVFINGRLMNGGAGNDYTVTYAANLMTITFLGDAIPQATPFMDVILVNYSV